MIRASRLLFLVTVGAAFSAGIALQAGDGVPSEEAPPDPVPLRRVLLSPEKLAAEMERAQQGLLVQLPRADFEARVKNAAQACVAAKEPPRLIEARYNRVKIKDSSLVGSAEWKVLNPGDGPALLNLPAPGFALRQLRWSDGKSALFGDLDGKDLALLVDAPGERLAFLEWSARGNPAGSGLRFSLDLPPCAVASLELELHKDYVVALSRDAGLLTGPHPAEQADHQTWRIAFAGRNQLNFDVRRVRGPDLPTPLVLNRLQAVQELTPGEQRDDFDFNLEVLHGAVTELRCECSPELRPYEVNVRNLDGWKLEAGPTPAAPNVLVIRLREPLEGGPLQVRCLAPLTSDKGWVSPFVRMLNTVSRGETLEVRIDPELQMDDWRPAGFRLLRTAFPADGKQILSLTAGLDGGSNPERPVARFPVARPDYKVRQLTWWQVGTDRPLLTSQVTCEVNRARIFRVPLQVPAGWEVEQVDLNPAELLRHWSVDRARSILLIEFTRGLEAGTPARVTVRLRAVQPLKVPNNGLTLAFPDLVPLEARIREGALALNVIPNFQAHVTASVPAAVPEASGEADAGTGFDAVADARPVAAGTPRVRPPWGKQTPDYYFPYKGLAVEGTLQLRPRPTQFRAVCHTDVVLTSGRGLALIRVDVQPEVGAPDFLDVSIAGPNPGRWEWQTVRGGNPVKRVEPLPARELASVLGILASRDALEAAAWAGLPTQRGSWWRLTFTRPLTTPLGLEASVQLSGEGLRAEPASSLAVLGARDPLGVLCITVAARRTATCAADQQFWEVPLVLVPEAERREGRVTLHLAGADLVRAESTGLQESAEVVASPVRSPGPAFSWRTYQYGSLPMSLTLRGRTPAADRAAETVVDRAVLASSLNADGELRHHYRFQVWNWRQQTLPVRLPANTRLLAARADHVWLDPLPSVVRTGDDLFIELPAASAKTLHRFEIVYTTAVAPTLWGARLEAPIPGLPLEPLAMRRIWELPPGLTPLIEGAVCRLPAGSAEVPGGRTPVASLLGGPGEDRSARLERQLTDALARLRTQYRPGEPVPVERLLGTLAYEDFKEPVPVVLDTWALAEAQITRTTTAAPSLEAPHHPEGVVSFAGELVIVPCPSALLVTTRSQWDAAQTSIADVHPFSSWDAALVEGFVFGHDPSGRFRRVDDWLEDERAAAPGILDQAGPEGSLWEPIAGSGDVPLDVVRPRVYLHFGLAFALLLPLTLLWLSQPTWSQLGPAVRLGWLILISLAASLEVAVALDLGLRWLGFRASERLGRRFLLGWLVIGGLCLLWLPPAMRGLAWSPACVGVLVAVAWFAREAIPRVPVQRPGLVRPAGVMLLLVGFVGSALPAAAPAPVTVFLVPDPEKPEKQTVLAPPELLDQLAGLTKRGVAGLRGAVLLRAEYEGRADAQMASLEARYRVHCFGDETATLSIPLGGVQLTEALVDGAATQPVAVKVPREGYTVEVKGQGSHSVVLRFAVPLIVTGEERDLRFTVPELPQSRLVLDVPPGAGLLHAGEARGWQHTSVEEKQVRLEADLGKVGTVRARWRRDGDQPRSPVVTVQEAYYWDLEASSARLLAVLQYSVTRGWETTFKIDLPRELEVYSAEAGPMPGGPAAPRLSWRVKEEGAGRRLHLDFQGPVTGGVQVTLVLVPRQPFGRAVTLPFPTPLDAQLGQGFLAYRADGLEASVSNHHAITGIERDRLSKSFADSFAQPWRSARQEELTAPARAFWRGKGGVLHLILRAPAPAVRGSQDVAWQVGPRQVGLRASARLTSAEGSLSFVEWEVPGDLSGIEITGPHVRSWSGSGSRLQVWFQKPVPETTIQLTGWLPRAKDNTRFDVPFVRIDARPLTTTLRVVGDGLTLKPATLTNLSPRADAAGREWAYSTDQDSYAAAFTTSTTAARAEFRLLTFAEIRDQQLTFVASLRAQVGRGELRNLSVSLRNWEGKDVTLDAPKVARRREQLTGPGGPNWLLELEPGVKDTYQLTLSGTLPVAAAAEVLMPDIRVETTDTTSGRTERWLAVAGSDLLGEEAFGLDLHKDGATAVAAWPREADRLRRAGGSVWEVKAEDWRLRLRPRRTGILPDPVQLFLTEHATAVPDGQRWVHQATFWIYHKAGADLNLLLPAGAEVLAVTLDGERKPPLQPAPDRLWLPLSGGRGGRVVRLTWTYPAATSTNRLGRLALAGPRLDGVADGPVVWTVHVPDGYELAGRHNQPGSIRQSSAAALDLARAAAQLRLLGQLIDQGSGSVGSHVREVQTVQTEFERYCRQAEYQLAMPGARANDLGPTGQSLTNWLRELRSQFAAFGKAHRLSPPRPDSTEAVGQKSSEGSTDGRSFPFDLTPFDRGQPHYWQTATEAEAPHLQLVAQVTQEQRQALTWSTLLLVLLLAVGILAMFFRATWPEQLALLGIIGALLFGSWVGLGFLVLPLACVVYRLFIVCRWLILWARVPGSPETGMP